MMKRPAASEFKDYYGKYVDLVGEGDIVELLSSQIGTTLELLKAVPESKRQSRYAPGKWTIAEVVGHMIDTERIMSYRALRIARNDRTPLAGFEQDDYVPFAASNDFALGDLAEELAAVRRATVLLFRNMKDEATARTGIASGSEVSVRALAYIIAGHELHHRGVLREKYL